MPSPYFTTHGQIGPGVKKRKKNTWKLMVRGVKSGTIFPINHMNSLARRVFLFLALALVGGFCGAVSTRAAQEAGVIRVLLLGDNGHHKPADFFKTIGPALGRKGVEVEYTDRLEDLNSAKLSGFDCLMIFANWTRIAPEQEKALLDFVEAGGGFVPVHCASFCFLNSPK
jgi:hypothetical protein